MVFIHLLDIEGTVCPISFVKDVLYPYALNSLTTHLSQSDFPPQASESNDITGVNSYLLAFEDQYTQSLSTFIGYVHDLTQRDIKLPAWKALQGYLWRFGYASGEIQVPLFDDAVRAIKRWDKRDQGHYVAIYSSGSIAAQKLLFKYVQDPETGSSMDLNDSLCAYFDTTTAGFKHKPESYAFILNDLKKQLGSEDIRVLFLSDNVKEVRAARESGMLARGVDRPGNHALTEEESIEMDLIISFDDLE
ncbi:2,3-diketo-5-methylthio-1-phosphopentane phosphatase [Nadsonia fulvescens var. elongata DSM 6958]|uniref:2,3-diketo-5-methylthio-1-phosphopentane phosphatase n=1 Tax=Nadsonia fulvescens var. elongata DSM 6958 TaxID=857566 RepID=A0A1E3PRQ9_9ASCO|nr:2,3-diketo-5-methylthio-1-phosphopentane phosphatase [Nadsonia fulvescens var. elongata DSM 6958]